MGARTRGMIRMGAAWALLAWTITAASACNNAGTVISGYSLDGASTAGTATGGATGGAADTFPQGDHTALAQIVSAGGSAMQTPVLQVFSFNSDANAELYETFIATLPHSAYWSSTTAEYGVGAATAAAPVRASLSATTGLTDGALARGETSDIESFLTAQLDVTSPPLGAPSANTLYILFMPTGMTVSLDDNAQSSACGDGVLAWHTAMRLPRTQVTIPYVVVPDCGAQGTLSSFDARTVAASHAIIEAVTDPHMDAYAAFDANHTAWQLPANGIEVGAACVAALYDDPNLFVTPSDLGFMVQRTWSNANALLGHTPCVPAAAPSVVPYFDSVPVLTSTITLPLGTNLLNPSVTLAGISLPPSINAIVPVQLFSDGTTTGPWTLTASEVGTSHLTLTTDKATGNNGDSINLSITAHAGATGQSLIRLTSTLGVEQHSQYILVAH